METSMALRTASIIVILGMSVTCFLALAADMRRHLGIDALENVAHRRSATGMQRAVALVLLLRLDHFVHDLGLSLLMPVVGPCAPQDEMILEPQHRVAERPGFGLRLRPVGAGIVGG